MRRLTLQECFNFQFYKFFVVNHQLWQWFLPPAELAPVLFDVVAGRGRCALRLDEFQEGLADALFIVLLAAHDGGAVGCALAPRPLHLQVVEGDVAVAVLAELPECGHDELRIHAVVGVAAVVPSDEPAEEDLQLGDLQVVVPRADLPREVAELEGVELRAGTALLRDGDEHEAQPLLGGTVAEGVVDVHQRGCCSEEAAVEGGGCDVDVEVVKTEGRQELRPVAVPFQCSPGFGIQR